MAAVIALEFILFFFSRDASLWFDDGVVLLTIVPTLLDFGNRTVEG